LISFVKLRATYHVCPLSLHDALPISVPVKRGLAPAKGVQHQNQPQADQCHYHQLAKAAAGILGIGEASGVDIRLPAEQVAELQEDRKSTRLNSSHVKISYAVFCLKKK